MKDELILKTTYKWMLYNRMPKMTHKWMPKMTHKWMGLKTMCKLTQKKQLGSTVPLRPTQAPIGAAARFHAREQWTWAWGCD
jgi:hypothetical protein